MTTIEQAQEIYEGKRGWIKSEVCQLASDFITLTKQLEKAQFELAEADVGFGGWQSREARYIREKETLRTKLAEMTAERDLKAAQLENCQRDVNEGNRQNALILAAFRKISDRVFIAHGKSLPPNWAYTDPETTVDLLVGEISTAHIERENATAAYNEEKARLLPEIELVSAKVHESWMQSKLAKGITSRKSEVGEELMVPYEHLTEASKDLDRSSVKAVYEAIDAARKEETR